MPLVNGPMPDPSEPQFNEPQGKSELRATYTYAKQIRDFRRVFQRDPANDSELDSFVEGLLTEMYNDGKQRID